jgi:DNA-binding beta-propeller fold protein YncE
MDHTSLEQIDRQLGDWLREERSMRAPDRLVEDVFARTTRSRQVRRWPFSLRPASGSSDRTQTWRFATALAGIAAVALVAAVGVVLIQPSSGPGVVGTPAPIVSPGPSVVPSPRASTVAPTPTPAPTPQSTTLGQVSARSLFLGTDAAPIAVTEAFGSIWVANIHANQVRRYDPATMTELARIPAPSAAWLAVTDGAIWVTHQTDVGLSRIDPATNTVVANVGDVPPCAEPILAFDSLWQSACDAGVILRIDPSTNEIQDRIPSAGHLWLTFTGDRILAIGSAGLAILDPETGTFSPLPNADVADAESLSFDGETVWARTPERLVRIDPANGQTISTLDYPGIRAVAFANGSAWLTSSEAVIEVDLETNEERRTIPLTGGGDIPFVTGDTLWATNFNNSLLWRVDL